MLVYILTACFIG